ncbi:hypothetical protein [Microbacterium sp. HMWF026]|uniref:hypothetical protein n=1 Tax=Microbacterium sp. HMWF026 TaxID=2056861 RepID=UPI0011B29806|nr:hypothetical protein [Microbacterium sp. HMWF026]
MKRPTLRLLIGAVLGSVLVGSTAIGAVAATAPAVSSTTSVRCADDAAVLSVTAKNTDRVTLKITIKSAYGSAATTTVKAGQSTTAAFATKRVSIPAGTASVTAVKTTTGSTAVTTKVSYPAIDCDPARFTYRLWRADNPTADQTDAYDRIEKAMQAATARYDRLTSLSRFVNVYYEPGVPTAEASSNGDLRYGADRAYMVEGTTLHEIAHTLGVGTTYSWDSFCYDGTYHGAKATALLRSWDGAGAVINCDAGHFWPYGLNYSDEFSETAFDRNVQLVNAMREDGLTND